MSETLKQKVLALNRVLAPEPTGVTPRLRPLPGIRCVAFDIYGTLLISGSGDISTVKEDLAEDLKAAILAAHEQRRGQGITRPEVDIRDIWRQVLGRPDVDAHAIAFEALNNPVWPMPGMKECLHALQGFTLGIVSNAQFYTPLTLEAFLEAPLQDFGFNPEHCIWSYRLLEAKPSPRLFECLLEATGIPAEQTLYVGNDMLNDIWAATQHGIRTALFAGDRRSLRLRDDRPECRAIEPDLIITELNQLMSCLNSN